MRKILTLILIFTIQFCCGQQFQLAPPILKYRTVFFADTVSCSILFKQPGSAVHYTLNGQEPNSSDKIYTRTLQFKKGTIVKAKAFGKDFASSETVSAQFVKDGLAISSIHFSTPNPDYSSSNEKILHDNIGGSLNFKNGEWLGYNTDTAEFNITLKKKQAVKTVLLDIFQDEGSWLFLPEQILVMYYDIKQHLYIPAANKNVVAEKASPKNCNLQQLAFTKTVITDRVKIIILPVKKIPDWHSGKGSHAWFFIDEIKLY
ncbi:MAG: FN3 associated domain-containing protein [Ferruginibacter sp.]